MDNPETQATCSTAFPDKCVLDKVPSDVDFIHTYLEMLCCMLLESLGCPLLIAPSVFSGVFLASYILGLT
jgi:hypothetical protein